MPPIAQRLQCCAGLLAAQQLQQQRRQPSLAAAAQRRRGTHARPGRSSALGVMSYHHDELGSSSDRSKRMEDADRRSVASAARSRENPDVLEKVDAVLESVPPSSALFTLRLLTHAVDLPQVAEDQRDSIDEQFFAELKALLQSQAFKDATNGHAPGNTPELASAVLQVFDSAWRAALAVRQQ